MRIAEELLVTRSLSPGHELALSLLLTREYLTQLLDERVFKPANLSDQQFNILRILKGGPEEGYAIGELRRRVIVRNADLPRLVDRMVAQGLVRRCAHPQDRRSSRVQLTLVGLTRLAAIAPVLEELMQAFGGLLDDTARESTTLALEALRGGIQKLLTPP